MLSSRSILILSLLSIVLQSTYGRWPETICLQWKESVPLHKCSLPRREEWTIHGLWPNKFHKKGPFFCNKTQHFNASALAPIMHQLDEKWMNVKDGTPHFSFWQHEWDKHGTCASVIENLNTELKYFQKALDLFNEHDITRVLARASILPGRNYAVQDIINGVERILQKNVHIECIKNPKTHESFISNISICLDKSLRLINCNEISGSLTNCDRRMVVNYPATTPSEVNVVMT